MGKEKHAHLGNQALAIGIFFNDSVDDSEIDELSVENGIRETATSRKSKNPFIHWNNSDDKCASNNDSDINDSMAEEKEDLSPRNRPGSAKNKNKTLPVGKK